MMRALLLLWSLAPLLWQLRTSFLVGEVLVGGTAGAGLSPWTLANYRLVLGGDPSLGRVLLNSALLGGVTTLLTLLLAVPCAEVKITNFTSEWIENRSAWWSVRACAFCR